MCFFKKKSKKSKKVIKFSEFKEFDVKKYHIELTLDDSSKIIIYYYGRYYQFFGTNDKVINVIGSETDSIYVSDPQIDEFNIHMLKDIISPSFRFHFIKDENTDIYYFNPVVKTARVIKVEPHIEKHKVAYIEETES